MNSLPAQTRESRRARILRFFCAHIGTSFPTAALHSEFGSAFRTRTSELNRDPTCPIVIRNRTDRSADGAESSHYWSEWKFPQQATFPGFLCDQAAR